MKTTERFERAFERLFNGWKNGTLAPGTCFGCAVGNMVLGDKSEIGSLSLSNRYLYTIEGHTHQDLFLYMRGGCTDDKGTGYSSREAALIEKAFETHTHITHVMYGTADLLDIIEDQYNGLIAVLDVLCEMDNIPKEVYLERLHGLKTEKELEHAELR